MAKKILLEMLSRLEKQQVQRPWGKSNPAKLIKGTEKLGYLDRDGGGTKKGRWSQTQAWARPGKVFGAIMKTLYFILWLIKAHEALGAILKGLLWWPKDSFTAQAARLRSNSSTEPQWFSVDGRGGKMSLNMATSANSERRSGNPSFSSVT